MDAGAHWEKQRTQLLFGHMSYVRARAELRSHSEIQIHQLAEELQRLTIEEKGSERKEEENKSQATDVQRPCTLM